MFPVWKTPLSLIPTFPTDTFEEERRVLKPTLLLCLWTMVMHPVQTLPRFSLKSWGSRIQKETPSSPSMRKAEDRDVDFMVLSPATPSRPPNVAGPSTPEYKPFDGMLVESRRVSLTSSPTFRRRPEDFSKHSDSRHSAHPDRQSRRRVVHEREIDSNDNFED